MLNKRTNAFIIAILCSVLIGTWVYKIIAEQQLVIDKWTREVVPSFEGTYLFHFMRWMTELGSGSFLIPFTICMAVLLFIWFKRWIPALIFSGGTLFAHLLNQTIKALVKRERPSIWVEVNAEGFSFPSGHAMIPFVCYGLLAYYIGKKIKSTRLRRSVNLFFGLIILMIGLSRYIINVHYLTDVIAGFIIGFGCLIGIIFLDRSIHMKRTQS